MKPERSESIELGAIPEPWTVVPPQISKEFEFPSSLKATKFFEFVSGAAESWELEVDLAAKGRVLTVAISPEQGDILPEAVYEFGRGINAAYRIFQSGPTPEN